MFRALDIDGSYACGAEAAEETADLTAGEGPAQHLSELLLTTLGADAEWALDFDMNLTDGVDDFKGSVVWSRPSWIYGKEMGTYALVQVIDERGAVIEPAWSQFVAYQSSPDAGDTPGTLHYRQID